MCPDPSVKSQEAIGYLRNGTNPLEEPFDLSGPIDSRGRSVTPSVRYVDD